MRFMMLVKHAENSGRPPKELMDAIAKLVVEAVKAGTMVGSGGLAPTAQSTRVRISNGELKVIDGPFTETKEVVGGYAQFEFKSREEALEGAKRFMELHRHHTGPVGKVKPRSARCLPRKTSRSSARRNSRVHRGRIGSHPNPFSQQVSNHAGGRRSRLKIQPLQLSFVCIRVHSWPKPLGSSCFAAA